MQQVGFSATMTFQGTLGGDKKLVKIGELANSPLRVEDRVSVETGFDGIPAAIERNRTGPRIGKVVADFSR